MSNRMDILIEELNNATIAYDKGAPIMTDKEWDDKFFELVSLEAELGYCRSNSPTQTVFFETISELKKIQHNHPMLSLAKTKSIDEVNSFIGDKDIISMCKMDGLTCSLYYTDGRLVRAETRGNGIEGEDVTHNALVIKSIPNYISYKKELVIDGEIICTYDDFKEFSKEYKNPRNFAAGSIRLLDAKECAKRKLTFVAWDVIKGFEEEELLSEKLYKIAKLGFIEVPLFVGEFAIDDLIAIAEECGFPIDGLVVKYNNCKYYQSLGRTDHHFRGGIAYKFYDETYETRLLNIEWTMGRTGQLTPVAIFESINIDGTEISRASLHNLSVMENLLGKPYIGQKIWVVKSNQIIPQIIKSEKISE